MCRPFGGNQPRVRAHTGGAAIATLVTTFLASGCASKNELRPPPEAPLSTHANARDPANTTNRESPSPEQVGLASWYGSAFAGKRTASGERFDPRLFTAAHRKLPFGTWVEVRRIDTGRTVRVRINDRGPNGRAAHRIIDLSQRAAEDLDIVRAGVVRVELRIVSGP
ncbi:MAG: Rare lipoprotein precursor [Labilithrix sp.]|nr:Rare lipoprotein precursor [Labilithrix sp.]